MTPSQKSGLLDDLLDDECPPTGPGLPAVLRIVQRELQRRARRRCIAAGIAAVALLLTAGAVLLHRTDSGGGNPVTAREGHSLPAAVANPQPDALTESTPAHSGDPASGETVAAAGIERPEIRSIGDDELLQLLDGYPVALATLRDGRRSLLIVGSP